MQAGPRDSLSLAAVGDKLGAAAEAAAAEVQPATTPPPAQPEKKHDLPDEDDSPKDRAQVHVRCLQSPTINLQGNGCLAFRMHVWSADKEPSSPMGLFLASMKVLRSREQQDRTVF